MVIVFFFLGLGIGALGAWVLMRKRSAQAFTPLERRVIWEAGG